MGNSHMPLFAYSTMFIEDNLISGAIIENLYEHGFTKSPALV